MDLVKVVNRGLPTALVVLGVQIAAPALTRWGTAVIRATVTEVRTAAGEAKKVAGAADKPATGSYGAGRETKAG
jgi:hypothetical protein